MDAPKIAITSQYQSFTSIIDWIEIYDAYVESKLSYRTFYKKFFPSLIKNIMPEGYIPSITAFYKHIFKIKKDGKDNYIRQTRGIANYKRWNNIYDELVSSGLSMNSFFEKYIKGNVKCARSGFYKRMLRIKQERLKMMNLDSNEKRVDVVTIESPQLSQTQRTPTLSEQVSLSPKKPVTVTVNLTGGTSISFDSTNPEYSAAKIIATLGRM